jgi:hypothetical protein
MSAEFDIGTIVVCIDGRGWNPGPIPGERFPCKGEILTIREIMIDNTPGKNDTIFFRFVEIANPIRIEFTGEIAFARIRFRPVRKTDISIFTELLETPPLIVELVE